MHWKIEIGGGGALATPKAENLVFLTKYGDVLYNEEQCAGIAQCFILPDQVHLLL